MTAVEVRVLTYHGAPAAGVLTGNRSHPLQLGFAQVHLAKPFRSTDRAA